jgi:hypothetical protein
MPRLLGQQHQITREIPNKSNFSVEGNEIAWELLETKYL